MQNVYFYDQTLSMIERGHAATALPMLVGKLYNAYFDEESWSDERVALRSHPLYALLQDNPYVERANVKPRGYAGDAVLIDYLYDRSPNEEISGLAKEMFDCSVAFQAAEGVRLRRAHAQKVVSEAYAAGKRVAVLACGHFREADALIGQDMSRFTLIDQDPLSLERVRQSHPTAQNICANVMHYLRNCASSGERFDVIYTLGLTDYLDARAMHLLHRLMKNCLVPGGTILLANFLPNHLAVGWMDAVMDWHLICRDAEELEAYALAVGMKPQSWIDPTGSIAWCRMDDMLT